MAAKKLSFEEKLSRLEEIVAALEKGDAPLADSLRLFEEGTKLVNACSTELDKAEQYVDSKTLEEYGQRQRNCNLEDMDMDSWRRVADALGIPTGEPLAPVLERFRKATQRQPLYQCIFHEDDGSLTESYGLMFE